MKTLHKYLETVDESLQHVILSLAEGVKKIAAAVEVTASGKAGTTNVFGEEQIAMDVKSNEILNELMDANKHVGVVASEEMGDEMQVGDGEYAVCYDPLDGSSLADVNLSIGTIVGIYERETFIGAKGSEQVAALIGVYGPRTTILLTVGNGVAEFVLRGDDEFVLTQEGMQVGPGKMFAPGNLRACKFREDYLGLVNYWIKEQYTLRYSGGMVPDINQIILKEKGIFSYPGYQDSESDEDYTDGKLRLLYECAPMAFLMEQAGGAASDGKMRILDKEVRKLAQRTPIFIGSKEEVERCQKALS